MDEREINDIRTEAELNVLTRMAEVLARVPKTATAGDMYMRFSEETGAIIADGFERERQLNRIDR